MTALSMSRPSGRSGHYAQHILIGAIAAATTLAFLPIGAVLNLALGITVLAAVVFAWLSLRDHDRRLCERCVTSMPLNASEQSVRYRRRFVVAHLAQRKLLVAGYLAALIGTNLMLVVNSSPPVKLAWAMAQLSMVFLVLSHSSHRKFQPWCPQCASGGTEQRQPVEPLVPTGVGA